MRNSFKWWFLLLLAAATACTKKADVPPTEYIIPKEAADYLMIPAGSYFIYKDSESAQLDSVVLETCRVDRLYQNDHTVWEGSPLFGREKTVPGYWYQKYTLTLRSPARNALWLSADSNDEWYQNGPSRNPSALVFGDAEMGDGITWNGTIFYYPLEPGMSKYIGPYNVEGNTYQDVLLANRDGQLFYWAKGVGIIKRVVNKQFGKTYTSTLVRRGKV